MIRRRRVLKSNWTTAGPHIGAVIPRWGGGRDGAGLARQCSFPGYAFMFCAHVWQAQIGLNRMRGLQPAGKSADATRGSAGVVNVRLTTIVP